MYNTIYLVRDKFAPSMHSFIRNIRKGAKKLYKYGKKRFKLVKKIAKKTVKVINRIDDAFSFVGKLIKIAVILAGLYYAVTRTADVAQVVRTVLELFLKY